MTRLCRGKGTRMFKSVDGHILLEDKVMSVEQVVMILNKQKRDLKECYSEIADKEETISEITEEVSLLKRYQIETNTQVRELCNKVNRL